LRIQWPSTARPCSRLLPGGSTRRPVSLPQPTGRARVWTGFASPLHYAACCLLGHLLGRLEPDRGRVGAGLYLVRMFGSTAFYHRYFFHRSYRAGRFWQFLFAVLGNSSAQRGPLWWAAHHRHHHRYADQEENVHSPVRHGFWWSHMIWLTTQANFPTRKKITVSKGRPTHDGILYG
jgi:hypothetical protein